MLEEILRVKPAAAKGRYLRSITLASTMGPGMQARHDQDPRPARGGCADRVDSGFDFDNRASAP